MRENNYISINNRKIGPDYPPYIVAEMSGNHNKDIQTALKIIKKAKESGADAVKIQTYTPDTITINHNSSDFIIKGGIWNGMKLYDLYQEAFTPWEWHQELFDYAKKIGITIFSSPFDKSAVDFLETLDAPAYKIASPELVDHELIEYVASKKKPIILSTGMATKEEILESVNLVRSKGSLEIILLHCTSAYPAPYEEANLSTLNELSNYCNTLVGLSDHTLGTLVSTISASLGAVLIEKHFTLSREEGGVDSSFSIESSELKELVNNTKIASKVLGKPAFEPTESEQSVLKNRRSLYVVKNILKGEKFTPFNVRSIRPGYGLKPKFLRQVLGSKASRDISYGEPLNLSMIDSQKK